METYLPLFPLGLVLYPGEHLPLHIFEPRYRALLTDCLDGDIPFGILLAEEEGVASVGCSARVSEVLRGYEDGRSDIVVTGEHRFRIREIYEDAEPYLTAEVEWLPEPDEPVRTDLKERLVTQHMKLLEIAGRTVRPSLYQDVAYLSYLLAHNAGMEDDQKQQLLELPSENERIGFLVQHFEALLPELEEAETLRRRIQSNGYFKHFPPEAL